MNSNDSIKRYKIVLYSFTHNYIQVFKHNGKYTYDFIKYFSTPKGARISISKIKGKIKR